MDIDGHGETIIVRKASLKSIIQDAELLKINRIATAAYLFVLEHNQDENFNADVYITPDFFTECVRHLQYD